MGCLQGCEHLLAQSWTDAKKSRGREPTSEANLMKLTLRNLLLCIFLSLPLLAQTAEARTLVFTYTTAGTIKFYQNQPIRFSFTRDFKLQKEVFVTGLNQTVTVTLHDDGMSIFRPYFINIYVGPFRGQPLPYPVFFPNPPGAGKVTIKVDDGDPVEVFMFIDPFEGLASGPMAASFVF
jgi:hypothetical protein